MKNIPYGRQEIDEDDCRAVLDCLKGDFLTQGPNVKRFEEAFAEFVGARFAIAVSNGTAALHLACLALDVKPGSKVLVPGNTFAASANCVLYCGGEVSFVDIDGRTGCLDLEVLEAELKKSGPGYYRGVVAVDYAGHPVDTERLRVLAGQYGLWIIEDACHAPGARFRASQGDWVRAGGGRYADLSIFSFHPVKHLTTGEGGMITTNDESLYRKIMRLRTHGITKDEAEFERPSDGPWYHEMQELGFNYRLPDLNCALGLSQLKKMESNLKRRQDIARTYRRELAGLPLGLPEISENIYHAYHLFVVRSQHRALLYEHLKSQGIYCQVHYIPVYRHPYYQRLMGRIEKRENDQFYLEALSLPMYHSMTDEDLDYVVRSVRNFFEKK